jgi:hypothetical protein
MCYLLQIKANWSEGQPVDAQYNIAGQTVYAGSIQNGQFAQGLFMSQSGVNQTGKLDGTEVRFAYIMGLLVIHVR